MHCDHTVHVSVDLSLWSDRSNVLGSQTPRHVHAVFFPVPSERDVGYGCANCRRDISKTVDDREVTIHCIQC